MFSLTLTPKFFLPVHAPPQIVLLLKGFLRGIKNSWGSEGGTWKHVLRWDMHQQFFLVVPNCLLQLVKSAANQCQSCTLINANLLYICIPQFFFSHDDLWGQIMPIHPASVFTVQRIFTFYHFFTRAKLISFCYPKCCVSLITTFKVGPTLSFFCAICVCFYFLCSLAYWLSRNHVSKANKNPPEWIGQSDSSRITCAL
jgi:hypothetical protein